MTLGSLFDGSGGFPLAGLINGITPVWASEIEPFPIRVTKARLPDMKHLGDITKINGAEIEPVDIITFGSPCQDLSVAGKQAGLHEGKRSNLFFEAIRIIKEMRNATANVDIRPRFAVWENVPGAFSSNKGDDFRAVLQALCEIADPDVSIPQCKKWQHAGCIVGNGYSLAWRLYDAQFWGVPQRRKRIYLIADFGSERAGEILFERESVCGDYTESGTERQGTAADIERSPGRSSGVRCLNPITLKIRCGKEGGGKGALIQLNKSATLSTANDQTLIQPRVCYALQGNGIDRSDTAGCNGCGWRENEMYTLNTIDRPGVVYCYEGQSVGTDQKTAYTLQAGRADQQHIPSVVYPINTMVATRDGKDDMRTCFGVGEPGDPQFTISAAHEHAVAYTERNDVKCVYPEKTDCLCAQMSRGLTGQEAANDLMVVSQIHRGGA